MQALWDLIVGLGPWNWLIFAVFLILLETLIPGIYFVWFGMAATIVGIVALASGISWEWQVLMFAVLSLATAFVVRHFSRPSMVPSDEPDLNQRGNYYVGRIVNVEEAIVNGRGRVRVGDGLWTAEGPDAPAGTRVEVKTVNGTVMVVEPV